MGHKPLILDPKVMRPLPGALWDISCDMCDKRQARWELATPELLSVRKGTPVCSLCWLYESEWGKPRRDDIDHMIADVETEVGREFKRTEDGRLWSCADANRILSSIALTSRLFNVRGMVREAEDGT
jgi:hypothetical protein